MSELCLSPSAFTGGKKLSLSIILTLYLSQRPCAVFFNTQNNGLARHRLVSVFTWQQFKCPYQARKSRAIERYNWDFKSVSIIHMFVLTLSSAIVI
jgi:hypothetical protein